MAKKRLEYYFLMLQTICADYITHKILFHNRENIFASLSVPTTSAFYRYGAAGDLNSTGDKTYLDFAEKIRESKS